MKRGRWIPGTQKGSENWNTESDESDDSAEKDEGKLYFFPGSQLVPWEYLVYRDMLRVGDSGGLPGETHQQIRAVSAVCYDSWYVTLVQTAAMTSGGDAW